MIQLAGLLLLLLFLFLPLLFFITTLKSSKLPPGPNAWQLLLNISQFRDKPHVAFHNLAKIYGPLMSIRLGGRLIVVASSPATAKAILKTHDRVFSGRFLPAQCYAIPGAIQSSNGTWKSADRTIHDLFSSVREVESKSELKKQKVLVEMMEYLVEKQGQVVKLDDVLNATVFNIFGNVLASRNLLGYGSCGNEEIATRLVNEFVEMASAPGLVDVFPVLKRVDFWNRRWGEIMQRKVMCVWEDILKERRARNGSIDYNARDFLDVLVDNEFSDDHTCFVLMALLVGGTESTLVTMIWLIVELMRNQDILSRVRLEIAQAIETKNGMINDSILSTCEYFQACVKETMRLHIPGPLLQPHQTIEKCVLDDYTIPEDTVVLVNAWAIHMDPGNWENATSFKPDRFLDSKFDFNGNYFEFIPFSSGRKLCPGYKMGTKNIQLIVACLIHYFDWSLPDGKNPENLDTTDVFDATLKREKPLFMIPRVRVKYVV